MFKAQARVEAVKREATALEAEVDWSAEGARAEAEAVARLGISSVDEALRRAGEVEQVKRGARGSVEVRQGSGRGGAR